MTIWPASTFKLQVSFDGLQKQFLLQYDSGSMEVDMIHQERRKAMEAMEEAMNVQQQMRRYESKYINQSFISCYENR